MHRNTSWLQPGCPTPPETPCTHKDLVKRLALMLKLHVLLEKSTSNAHCTPLGHSAHPPLWTHNSLLLPVLSFASPPLAYGFFGQAEARSCKAGSSLSYGRFLCAGHCAGHWRRSRYLHFTTEKSKAAGDWLYFSRVHSQLKKGEN